MFTRILKAQGPYAFKSVVFSHGWSDLPPFYVRTTSGVMDLVLRSGARPVRVTLRPAPGGLRVESEERLLSRALADLRWMFRLDDDLGSFYELLGREERPWALDLRMGRLLRSQSVFEDLIKLILTTNCAWSLTRVMADRLAEKLGEKTMEGFSLFPTARTMAGKGERFYREVIRAGYRSPNLVCVARLFASGRVVPSEWLDPRRPTEEIRKEILALPGAGPYVADNLLKFLGRFDHLGLDSWARTKLKELWGMKKVPKDTTIARRYRTFGLFQGLALLCDLTHDWFTTDQFKDWIRTGR
ncbi:MAG: Fe-S cluster assembly protein HesB [Pseudomonadota bacterium]